MIVKDVRPKSRVMAELRTAGIRKDIQDRILVTETPAGIPGFFPLFAGKTWEMGEKGRYRLTPEGDGRVPHRKSVLPGSSPDIIPRGSGVPGRYAHASSCSRIHLPKNPAVIDRILQYRKKSSA